MLHPGKWRLEVPHSLDERKGGRKNPQRPIPYMRVPDLGSLSRSITLGALGMPGLTAYYGLLDICQPKKGETVLVNSAGGAVGSLVCQIAKIKGCTVIAFAGSEEKISWLKNELHLDHIDFKSAKSPLVDAFILKKDLKIQGFHAFRWYIRWWNDTSTGGFHQMKQWIQEGKIKCRETKTKGFENMPRALLGIFKGENIGKAIVEV
ncbi:Prostaglandin reductase 1 [Armadillidium nasatum]|uniref:Prostaglandin reductase 1 n=1 Tax=Armadillidium nasatum TaxID=96803 RepID=A0A5N5T9C6_9CRUS|nr:Prostaglandin reductase 1 [Armadillidium nasatum]